VVRVSQEDSVITVGKCGEGEGGSGQIRDAPVSLNFSLPTRMKDEQKKGPKPAKSKLDDHNHQVKNLKNKLLLFKKAKR
jgi:hypothetical protein